MDNCLLHGKRICALALRNKHGQDIYELKREWKTAQYNGELICEDCGTPVELRAGDVKIPYFAHRKGFLSRDCYYENTKETEEHREAKSILYEYFVTKYPGATVQTTKRQSNGRRSDIYIDFGSSKLAIEFQRSYLKISDWDERHLEYEKIGITDLWILSSSMLENRRNDFDFLTQVLLHETTDNTALFLDVDKRKLSLLKEIGTSIIKKCLRIKNSSSETITYLMLQSHQMVKAYVISAHNMMKRKISLLTNAEQPKEIS